MTDILKLADEAGLIKMMRGTPAADAFAALAAFAARIKAEQWQPISTAPKDGTPLRLFSDGFINPDFNPGGSVEGQWCDDTGWIGAVWNPDQDCWDANEIVPTHWQPLPAPPAAIRADHE